MSTSSSNMIQSDYPDLYRWLKSISRYDDIDKFVQSKRDVEDGSIRIKIWTEEHEYSIKASLPGDNDTGYLGCIASSRKPRAGEDWTRGNDLSDGAYCEQTWQAIVRGIMAYELVPVEVAKEQPSVEEVEVSTNHDLP